MADLKYIGRPLWTEDLSDAQLKMLMRTERGRYGTALNGAADWKVARWLEARGLASIEGDPGQQPEALLWATEEGKRILTEFDDEEDEWLCPVCGLWCSEAA